MCFDEVHCNYNLLMIFFRKACTENESLKRKIIYLFITSYGQWLFYILFKSLTFSQRFDIIIRVTFIIVKLSLTLFYEMIRFLSIFQINGISHFALF